MKIRNYITIGAVALSVFACGCGSSGYSSKIALDDGGYIRGYYDMAPAIEAEAFSMDGYEYSKSYSPSNSGKSSYSDGNGINTGFSSDAVDDNVVQNETSTSNRKVIKNAGIEVQTLSFDEFVAGLKASITAAGGYIENASESGNNIYYSASRRAYYTIRVPEDKLDGLMNKIGSIGTVTSTNYSESDITLTYVDVESRIKTLKTEQETLLSLLEKASGLEDIIKLESRLSEVNYQIESYMSRLRTYDNQVSYATLNVNVVEVERITSVVEVEEPKTLGQRIAVGFMDNMKDIRDGIGNFIVWFLTYIINIIFWVAVIGCALFFSIRALKKHDAKRMKKYSDKKNNTNETKMDDNK